MKQGIHACAAGRNKRSMRASFLSELRYTGPWTLVLIGLFTALFPA